MFTFVFVEVMKRLIAVKVMREHQSSIQTITGGVQCGKMVDIYRNVLEKCDTVSLYKFSHYGVPGHNLHNQIDIEYECSSHDFPYNCMQPLPFLPPAKVSNRGEGIHYAFWYILLYSKPA